MPYSNDIIAKIDELIVAGSLTDKRFQNRKFAGLCYLTPGRIKDNSLIFAPAKITTLGECEFIVPDDTYNIISYHRLLSSSHEREATKFGDKASNVDAVLTVIGFTSKLRLTADELEALFLAGFPSEFSAEFVESIQMRSVTADPVSSNFDSTSIFNTEYRGDTYFLKPETIMFQIRYRLRQIFSPGCFTICCGEDDITQPASLPNMQGLFAVGQSNYGTYYEEWGNPALTPELHAAYDVIGFPIVADIVGSEAKWAHEVSSKGGFDLFPLNEPLAIVTPRVGFGANPNEIYHFTNDYDTDSAAELQEQYNATGVDFKAVVKEYAALHNQKFIYTVNIAHGTVDEMAADLGDLVDAGVEIAEVRYLLEASSGISGLTPGAVLTSAQYIAIVPSFDDYVVANHPGVPRAVNLAHRDLVSWSNSGPDGVAAFAKARGIELFTQYGWLGNNGGQAPVANTSDNIDTYMQVLVSNTRDSTATGNFSLYGEVLPRLQGYYDLMYPIRAEISQYGVSLQRTGRIPDTMFDGLMKFNYHFEIFKFNATHDNFIYGAVFIENNNAIRKKQNNDDDFFIEPTLIISSGGFEFIKTIQGIAYELFKPLSTYTAGYPVFVPVTFTNQPDKFDAVCFVVGTEVFIWTYNIPEVATIASIEVDGVALATNIDTIGAYSTKLYGSVGTSLAYNYFKDFPAENPGFTATPIRLLSNLNTASSNINIPEHSILKIKLRDVTTANSIKIIFT